MLVTVVSFWMTLILEVVSALRTEVIRGYPCVRKNHQLYCPTPGSKYPVNLTSSNDFPSPSSLLSTSTSGPSTSSTSSNRSSDSLYTSYSYSPASNSYYSSSSSSYSSKSKPYVIYYTKKTLITNSNSSDDNRQNNHISFNGVNNDGDNNDLTGPFGDENQYDLQENVIDDGDQVVKVKRGHIDQFIDENKSMIKRMFGEYNTPEDEHESNDHYAHYSNNGQAQRRRPRATRTSYTSNKVDSCESAVEIVTPYWASNSAGKIRAIVNTQHLQQAIQQEVCQSVQTKRCKDDCTCEQKYKWHRLLAYDPDDDCKGIFMDWFLFPSCCVCRCSKLLP